MARKPKSKSQASPQSRSIVTCDPIWSALSVQAEDLAHNERALASLAHATILRHKKLEDALSYHLARKAGRRGREPDAGARNLSGGVRRRSQDRRVRARRSFGRVRARSRLPFLSSGVPVLQRLPCARMPSHRAFAVDERAQADGAVLPEPRVGSVRGRHPPGGETRPRYHDGSRHRHRHRRDRGGGRRRFDAARRDAGRHRQGRRRPPSQDPPRRPVGGGREGAWAISRSANIRAWRRARSCSNPCRPTRRWPACRRGRSARSRAENPPSHDMDCMLKDCDQASSSEAAGQE